MLLVYVAQVVGDKTHGQTDMPTDACKVICSVFDGQGRKQTFYVQFISYFFFFFLVTLSYFHTTLALWSIVMWFRSVAAWGLRRTIIDTHRGLFPHLPGIDCGPFIPFSHPHWFDFRSLLHTMTIGLSPIIKWPHTFSIGLLVRGHMAKQPSSWRRFIQIQVEEIR